MEQVLTFLIPVSAGLVVVSIYKMVRLASELSRHTENGNIFQIILRGFLPNAGAFDPEWQIVKPSGYVLLSRFLMWFRIFQIFGLILMVYAVLGVKYSRGI